MPAKCCIKSCGHICGAHHSGHEIPHDLEKRKKWLEMFAFHQIEICTLSARPLVCQCHFNSDQFNYNKKKFLKPYAFPVNFNPNENNIINENIVQNEVNNLKIKEYHELIDLRKIKHKYECLITGLSKFLTENQISHIMSDDKHLKYDNQTVIKCVEFLRITGYKTYEFIRKFGYPLPSYRTVMERMQTLNSESEEAEHMIAIDNESTEDQSVDNESFSEVSEPMITVKKELNEDNFEDNNITQLSEPLITINANIDSTEEVFNECESTTQTSQQLLSINPNLILCNKSCDNNNQNIEVSKLISIKIENQNDDNLVNDNDIQPNMSSIDYNSDNIPKPVTIGLSLKCSECNITFNDNYKYGLHKRDYHKNFNYIYDGNEGQSESFSDNSEYSKSQTNREQLETTFEKVFVEPEVPEYYSLESNSNNTKGFKSFDCGFPNCYSKYKSLDQLKEHISGSHLIYKYFNCFECDLRFESETQLKKHNNEWHSVTTSVNKNIIEITDDFDSEKQNISKTKQLICEFAKCDRVFNSKLKLKSHLLKAHSVKRLKCNSCHFETNLMSAFIKHKNSRKHSRIGKDPYVCSLNGCDKSFKHEESLELHQNVFHFKNNPYNCEKCEKSFAGKLLLERHHVRDHCEHIFQCDLCDYKIHSKFILTKHMTIHKNMRFKCGFNGCEKVFKSKHYLQNHRYQVHKSDNKKKFTCYWPECGVSFSLKDKLNSHINQHKNEKPYVCDWPECEANFSGSRELSDHRNKHLKPYKCQSMACNLRFSSKPEMLKHFKSKHK